MSKVSIIVPVYNMEGEVEQGLVSLTEQTYSDIEIVIIDDGSTDSSYLKCLAWADKDKRITVFSKNNEGPAKARNYALGKITGEYVYFFDMDDYIEKNAIERFVYYMEKENVDLVACSFSMFNGKKIIKTINKIDGIKKTGAEARHNYYDQLFFYGDKGIQGAAWYKLYRTDIIKDNGIEFPDLRKSEDDVFVARYMSHNERGFYITGEVLCRYTVNSYKRFWDKYPFDIFHTARQSTLYMADIVRSWNGDNKKAMDRIYEDYFQKTFGSFCFLFNPKLKLKKKDRLKRMEEITETFLGDIPKEDFSVPHRVFFLMKKKEYKKIYFRILLHVIKHKND